MKKKNDPALIALGDGMYTDDGPGALDGRAAWDERIKACGVPCSDLELMTALVRDHSTTTQQWAMVRFLAGMAWLAWVYGGVHSTEDDARGFIGATWLPVGTIIVARTLPAWVGVSDAECRQAMGRLIDLRVEGRPVVTSPAPGMYILSWMWSPECQLGPMRRGFGSDDGGM